MVYDNSVQYLFTQFGLGYGSPAWNFLFFPQPCKNRHGHSFSRPNFSSLQMPPPFIEGWPTPSGVAQIGLRPGQDPPPETVSFTGWSSANSNLRFPKILAVPLGSGLVGCRGAGVPGGGEATGRCLLRIQRFFLLDALAKESQDHKALTLPPPKRPAQTLTTLVSSKRPKQNPQPTGRGRVKFQGQRPFPRAFRP